MPHTNAGRTRIFWEEEGSGEPVLMIMGLGFSSLMWRDLRPFMAEHFRTIVFDNRGVGKSSVPVAPYSIPTMARDAVGVLDAAGVGRAHVVGMSMGGMIAQEMAIRYPDRVARLVLGCTMCGRRRSVPPAPEVRRALIPRLMASRESRIDAVLPFIYDPNTPRDRVEADLAVVRQNPPPILGYVGQLLAIAAWSSYERLPQIAAPTLVLHGKTDRLVPAANAAILAEAIPNARLVLLDNASHIFPTEQPERTRAELLNFLCGLSSTP